MKFAFTVGSSTVLHDPLVTLTDIHPVARIVGRLTMGRPADQIASWIDADRTPLDIAEELLAEAPLDVDLPALDEDDDWDAATNWWLDVMRRPDTGVHERMIWFWHGHLTSGLDKSGPAEMMRQHGLLRRHALGNFRTMLQEITLDPAMLGWLDGGASTASAPNENYARELMELFALGQGAYTEADVHNGARALAGYRVNENHRVVPDRDAMLTTSVEFLGSRVRTASEVIDTVCDHPACAPHVVAAMYTAIVGSAPEPERLNELAELFRSSGLEIAPVVRAIVLHPSLLEGTTLRPRSPVEWFLAFERLTGAELDAWTLTLMGQTPMNPPNVAGWPGPKRWISTDAVLTKASVALDSTWDTETLDSGDPVADVIRRAGVGTVSASTRSVLDTIVRRTPTRRELSSLLHATIALSPEFSVT
jgi:uncharacterized protein (DUF1800 family)